MSSDVKRSSSTALIPYTGHYFSNTLKNWGIGKWNSLPSALLGRVVEYIEFSDENSMLLVNKHWMQSIEVIYNQVHKNYLNSQFPLPSSPLFRYVHPYQAPTSSLSRRFVHEQYMHNLGRPCPPLTMQYRRSIQSRMTSPIDPATLTLTRRMIEVEKDEALCLFFKHMKDVLPPVVNLPDLQSLRALGNQNLQFNVEATHSNAAVIREWMKRNQNLLEQISSLSLTYLCLTVLPSEIGLFKGLNNLELTGNWLRSLPDSIGSLSSLQELWLDHNQLKALPDSIGSLSALERLSASHNNLESLPDSIASLNLKNFWVNGNPLKSLPKGFKIGI